MSSDQLPAQFDIRTRASSVLTNRSYSDRRKAHLLQALVLYKSGYINTELYDFYAGHSNRVSSRAKLVFLQFYFEIRARMYGGRINFLCASRSNTTADEICIKIPPPSFDNDNTPAIFTINIPSTGVFPRVIIPEIGDQTCIIMWCDPILEQMSIETGPGMYSVVSLKEYRKAQRVVGEYV